MKIFYIGVCFFWILFACSKEAIQPTLTGTWRLTAYYYPETGTLETEPPGLNNSVEINFSDDGLTGTISGHTVSNQVFGMYTLQPRYQLTLTDFYAITKVGEPEWGNKFWERFSKAGFYEAYAGRLIIYYGKNGGSMIFERQ